MPAGSQTAPGVQRYPVGSDDGCRTLCYRHNPYKHYGYLQNDILIDHVLVSAYAGFRHHHQDVKSLFIGLQFLPEGILCQ
ncbi:hypothetical protein D6Q47_22740 [Salmonella enterica subsp. enterica serovar Stanley]|nr:hypothetical protein [Salmonella enterica subsp. enterica serovar Stanley]